ncbi:MAG: DUF3019 domain-containing protein [Pseudomonadota bacterium]
MFLNNDLLFSPRNTLRWLYPMRAFVTTTLSIFLVFASDRGHAAEELPKSHRLRIRPSICVSYDSTQPCTMAMEVSWEGQAMADVCLRGVMISPMLACWKNARDGNITLDYANTADMVYQLVEEATQGLLAEAEVKVINRDLRSSRKRRRHVWSIL